MNTEEALHQLAQGFASMDIGVKFFRSLAAFLSKTLGVDYVFIGELTKDNQQVRSVAFYAKGQIVDNIEYPLAGSLCEKVVKPDFCVYPSHVQELFPHNQALKQFGVDSYVGTPLVDSYGKVLGLIYIMHSGPVTNLEKTQSLLSIVAKRAELELEREQQERWLQEVNQELEKRVARRTSALLQSEQVLKERMSQLQRINNDLDNFIYTASHDLKAPISNIEGLIKLLENKLAVKGWSDSTTEGITGMIHESISRFKQTISYLTDITKLDKGSEMESTELDIAAIAADVEADLREPIRQAGARISLQLQACPHIFFSRKNLQSIIYNLLSNAVKYRAADREPHINLSCAQSGEYVVLSVADNGLGIDLQEKSKLFSMFTRLHDHVEGSGVGLYMVKKMIENARGRIEVESEVGKGSTFRVYFKVETNRQKAEK